MNRFVTIAAALLAFVPMLAHAQTTAPVYQGQDGQTKEAIGTFPVGGTAAGGASAGQIQGNTASGATDVGNPVKMGYRDTSGNRQDQLGDALGNTYVTLRQGANSVATNAGSSLTGSSPSLTTRAVGFVTSDGSNFTPARGDLNGSYAQGNAAHGAVDIGNPLKMGCRSQAALPASTAAGNRTDVLCDQFGKQVVALGVAQNAADGMANTVTAPTPLNTGTSSGLLTANLYFNGAFWDRVRGDVTGAYVVQTPTAAAANAITPVAGSLVASITAKAAPGNLYSVSITTGASAVYLYVFNATAAPADGAVTAGNASGNYQVCTAVGATTTFTQPFEIPERYSVGITPVVSSTACGTLTKATTAVFIKSRAQ